MKNAPMTGLLAAVLFLFSTGFCYGLPDLTITNLTFYPPTVDVDQMVSVRFLVHNIGNAAAYPATYSYISQAGGYSYLIYTPGQCTGSTSLAPGAFCVSWYNFTFPTAGSKFMKIMADSNDNIQESNEGNNIKEFYINVQQTASCTDSDGGYYPYVKGTVTSTYGTATDICYSSTRLNEFVCSGSTFAYYNVTCNCTNGACIQPDTMPPSQVTGLTATAISPTQINLAWNAATDNVGVAGYRVYRNGTLIAVTNMMTYSNSGLTAGTTYGYYVIAYDAAGNLGVQSATVSATTPAQPGGLYGACIVRSNVNLPMYDAPSTGTGYAKYNLGSVTSLDDATTKCNDDIYNSLNELYCANNTISTQWQVATYTYNNGTYSYYSTGCAASGCGSHYCTNKTACTDTDGGKNYYVKGTVTDPSGSWTDYCYGGEVVEHYCTDTSWASLTFYSCPNGCSDGACYNNTCLPEGRTCAVDSSDCCPGLKCNPKLTVGDKVYGTCENSTDHSVIRGGGSPSEPDYAIPNTVETEAAPFTFYLKKGWNMISSPFITSAEDFKSLETTCTFTAGLWELGSGSYRKVLKTGTGHGYWIKVADSCSVTMPYTKPLDLAEYSIDLVPGWNFVGSQMETASFSEIINDCSVTAGPYWYNPSKNNYELAYSMEPGKGYLVKVSNYCSLTMGSGSPPVLPA